MRRRTPSTDRNALRQDDSGAESDVVAHVAPLIARVSMLCRATST